MVVLMAHLRHTLGRAAALVIAVLVAATGFTVLTATARTSQLQVVGTVHAHSRSAYDILVRPRDSRSTAERTEGLIRGDFLSGIFGGITTRQYKRIKALRGVAVAAPVELVGYSLLTQTVAVDVTKLAGTTGTTAVKVQLQWGSDRGLTTIADHPQYVYTTANPVTGLDTLQYDFESETLPDGKTVLNCPLDTGPANPYFGNDRLNCWNRNPAEPGLTGSSYPPFEGVPSGHRVAYVDWPIPVLIAAIDPRAEAQLDGVKSAVVSGRYLAESDADGTDDEGNTAIPVLASNTLNEDATLTARATLLPTAAAAAITSGASAEKLDTLTAAAPAGPIVARFTAAQVYARLLTRLKEPATSTTPPVEVPAYWTGSTVTYADHHGTKTPATVTNPTSTWASQYYGTGFGPVPVTTLDRQFRTLTNHEAASDSHSPFPSLKTVGTFDPAKITGFDSLTAVPLGLFRTPSVTGATLASRAALGGQPLAPDGALTSYLQQTPTILTTLAGAEAFYDNRWNSSAAEDPISSIRIRVAGAIGSDAVSRARVQQVAAAIEAKTGLTVDVTLGSSPAPQTIDLPAGLHGRPALSLTQNWVQKGVTTAIVSAVNRKSAILFLLVLIVCALVVANAAFASVRARIPELAVLSCLGWRPRRLFTLVTDELLLLGVTAGMLSAVLAIPAGHLAGVHVTWARALIALPVAMLLAVLAGLLPALAAARAAPMEAVRATARAPRRAAPVRSVPGLAVASMARRPGRSALAAAGLAVAVAAFTLLLAVTLAFQGSVVGSLLGNAITVQVRGVDYAAVAAILVLSGLGVADVLFISITERAVEFATLRAVGWRERRLREMVLTEGVVLGLVGCAAGAVIGLFGAALFLAFTPRLVLGALLAFAVGLGIAVIASLLTLTGLSGLRTVEVLAGAE
jgi:putative ABC transport system permease protein